MMAETELNKFKIMFSYDVMAEIITANLIKFIRMM